MARENDNNVEVIDPEDRRYKDDNYFNGNDHNERNYSIRYHYGCGCPFGCLSSLIISFCFQLFLPFTQLMFLSET